MSSAESDERQEACLCAFSVAYGSFATFSSWREKVGVVWQALAKCLFTPGVKSNSWSGVKQPGYLLMLRRRGD
jgi:hypothetical protein